MFPPLNLTDEKKIFFIRIGWNKGSRKWKIGQDRGIIKY